MELAGSDTYMKREEKKKETSSYLTPYIKLNSRRLVDINVKGETTKLLPDKQYFHDIGVKTDF